MRAIRFYIGIVICIPVLVFAQQFSETDEGACLKIGGKVTHVLRKVNGKQTTVDVCDCKNGKTIEQAGLQQPDASCDLVVKPCPRVTPKNEQKTCYACFYQKIPECGTYTDKTSCGSATPKETRLRGDCSWVSGACISRFENYCRNEWPATLDVKNNPGPLIIQERTIFTDASKKNNPVFEALSCVNPIITVDGHGEGGPTLFKRLDRCIAHASSQKITICDLGCSVAENREEMERQAEAVRKALAGTDMEVTLEANQADSSNVCPSSMKIVIKPISLQITYGLCSVLGGSGFNRCYRKQTAVCTDDTTKKERLAICCPQKPDWGYKNIFGGPAGEWIFNDDGKGCPDTELTDDMKMPKPAQCFSKGDTKDAKALTAYNLCRGALLLIDTKDEKKEGKIAKLFAAIESDDCQAFFWHIAKAEKKALCTEEEKALDKITKRIIKGTDQS